MNYRLGLFLIIATFAGCSSNKKPVSIYADTISIHKIWKYDTVRSALKNPGLIGKHFLDLTKKDTLHFSYQSIKDNSTAYSYSISHDSIFVNKKAAYKIVKLTAHELDLNTIFEEDGVRVDSLMIMVYKTK